ARSNGDFASARTCMSIAGRRWTATLSTKSSARLNGLPVTRKHACRPFAHLPRQHAPRRELHSRRRPRYGSKCQKGDLKSNIQVNREGLNPIRVRGAKKVFVLLMSHGQNRSAMSGSMETDYGGRP